MNEQYTALITELNPTFTLPEAQKLLDAGEIKERVQGNVLRQGGADKATSVLLLLKGKLEVFIMHGSEVKVLTKVDPGTFLGASAVLGIPRNASVRTSEPCVLLEWTLRAFRDLLLQNPPLSEKLLGRSLPAPVEKERTRDESLIKSQGATARNSIGRFLVRVLGKVRPRHNRDG